MGDFLIGLDQVAAQAAARLQSIDGEVSLDVVTFANLALLDEIKEPRKADASGKPETQTSGVDWGETLKVRILS